MDSKEEVNEKPTSEQFALKESEVPLNNTCFIPNESRKYRGVFPAGKRYRAVMQLGGIRHNLGMYSTEVQAARAYDKFAKDHGKKTNFPHRTDLKTKVYSATIRVSHKRHRAESHRKCSGAIELTANGHPFGASWAGITTRNTVPPSDAVTLIQSGCANHMPRTARGLPTMPGCLQHHLISQSQQDYHQDWQQFYAQHRQQLFQHQVADSYSSIAGSVPTQTISFLHPIVYVPVPLPIVREVTQYVHDYLFLEQQQMPQSVPSERYRKTPSLSERRPKLCYNECDEPIPDVNNAPSKVLLVSAVPCLELGEIEHGKEEHLQGQPCASQYETALSDQDKERRHCSKNELLIRSDAPDELVAKVAGTNQAEASVRKEEKKSLNNPASNSVASSAAYQDETSAFQELELSLQNENQSEQLHDTVEGQAPSQPPQPPDLLARTVSTEKKKYFRKRRRKASAAEEARLAASHHPAAPYITTIGPNLSTSISSSGGTGADTEAWRQQVRYYWHGTLFFDLERCVQVWRGSWLGVKQNLYTRSRRSDYTSSSGSGQSSDIPTVEAFVATATIFEYVSRKVRRHNLPQTAPDYPLMPQTGYYKGFFKMRSTKIKSYVKHPDHDFYIVFEPYVSGKDGLVHEYALCGRGIGEYGAFIVHGRYSNQTGQMQAVRVYLHETDDRAKMTLKQLQAWFQQGVSDKKNTSESNGDKSNNPSSNALGSDSKEPRKYRGVFPAGRRFRAVMQLDGVRHNLGMHSTEIEAARAYDRFAREHYKKTNFPYPTKPAGSATASAQRHLQASAAINSLSNELEQSGPYTSFLPNQNGQSTHGAYSWHGNAASLSASAGVASSKPYGSPNAQIFDEALHHGGYDDGFNQESYLGEQFHPARSYHGSQMSSGYTHRPLVQDWQQPQYLPEPNLQHPPFMFPQHRPGSHPMQTNTAHSPMTYVPHPVVYVPVPLPISEAVTKYVNDFHKFEQQQRSEPSSNLPPPVPRREPIFTQPHTPFPSMAASAAAPDLSSSAGPAATLTGSSSAPAAPLLYGAAAHLNHSPSAVQNVQNQTVELASHKRPRDDSQEGSVSPSIHAATRNASEGQEVESGSQASSDNSLDSDASFDDDDDDDDDDDEVDEQQ